MDEFLQPNRSSSGRPASDDYDKGLANRDLHNNQSRSEQIPLAERIVLLLAH